MHIKKSNTLGQGLLVPLNFSDLSELIEIHWNNIPLIIIYSFLVHG